MLRLLFRGGVVFSLLGLSLATAGAPIRVLLVTGGHEYETNQFLSFLGAAPGVELRHVLQPQAQEWFKADRGEAYDVVVLYDMWQEIGEAAKRDFTDLVSSGKGLLVLHHALGSYQGWPGYADLVGGCYHLDKWSKDGREQPGSTYLHDVDFKVRVLKSDHPVTRGLEDFEIHDETYGGFEVKSDVTPLLGTDTPTSGPVLAWVRNQGEGRVVYVQLGHDHSAYDNPAYRRLVFQSIRWVAKRN